MSLTLFPITRAFHCLQPFSFSIFLMVTCQRLSSMPLLIEPGNQDCTSRWCSVKLSSYGHGEATAAWPAAVHGVTKSQTRLGDWTTTWALMPCDESLVCWEAVISIYCSLWKYRCSLTGLPPFPPAALPPSPPIPPPATLCSLLPPLSTQPSSWLTLLFYTDDHTSTEISVRYASLSGPNLALELES